MKARKPVKTGSYSLAQAARYWTNRVRSTDPLAAVLTYNAPLELNRAYDLWERSVVRQALSMKRLTLRSMALDIGCGTGRITSLVAEKRCSLMALDISQEMLSRTRRALARKGLKRSVECIESPAHRIPLPSESLDLITCCGLLEHLPPRLRAATIGEIARILKPSGSALVMVNNDLNPLLRSRRKRGSDKIPGYHAELVGCGWLVKIADKYGLKSRVVAANPFYGLVHYGLYGNRYGALSTRVLNQLARFVRKMDGGVSPPAPFVKFFASHFLVDIRPKTARD